MNWSPQLTPPWSLTDLEGILEDALKVLQQIGVECTHPAARDALSGWSGASIVGERIYFAPAQVRDHWQKKRAQARPAPEGDHFTLGGCWAGLFYCDPETLTIRPATSADVALMCRLWDARGISGVVPVQPGDVPPALVTLAAERIALTHSRYLGGSLTVTDPEEVRMLNDMNAVAGRRYQLMEQIGISPLRFNHEALEAALHFRNHPNIVVHVSGFIPMAGATCPLDPRAAAVQSAAEELALDILCSVLDLNGGGLRIRLEPFDFQYLQIVFGSPEWCLYRALALQLSEYLTGRPVRSGNFRSVAKRPDAQAACERTASALWQAMFGVRHFGAVGQLSVDEVFSPQQAVLDKAILGYVERMINGLDLQMQTDALALIREGVEAKSYIGAEDTTSRYRSFYDFPDLFRHWNLGRWREEGQPDLLREAWERAQFEIATSTFRLAEEQQKEVDRIYTVARRRVAG
jgi:trimethylamine:corrinoid methyltransferase-like protein